MIKLNKWALAFANTVLLFHVAGMAALYIWGQQAIDYVEQFQLIRFSDAAMSLDLNTYDFVFGSLYHYVLAYLFALGVIYFYDHLRKGK